MKTELPESHDNTLPQSLDERFASRPQLRRRLLKIADMMDQAIAEGCTADEAEARAIEQIRQLGNEVLTEWAQKSEADALAKAREQNPKLRPNRKKKPYCGIRLTVRSRFWNNACVRVATVLRCGRFASEPK